MLIIRGGVGHLGVLDVDRGGGVVGRRGDGGSGYVCLLEHVLLIYFPILQHSHFFIFRLPSIWITLSIRNSINNA